MKVKRKIITSAIITAGFSLLFSGIIFADHTTKIYTLNQSIEQAFSNNLFFQSKKDKLNQAVYVKKQARSDFFPKLSTTYGYTRLSDVSKSRPIDLGFITIPGADQNSLDNYIWKGNVEQPLFTGFALASSYKIAKLGVDSAKIEIKLAKLDLAMQVKQAYFDILIAEKGSEVVRKELESLRSTLNVARNFYESGMIPINDVLKAEVEYANAKQNKIKAENAVKLAKSAFNEILSNPITMPIEVEDILSYSKEKLFYEMIVESALRDRPEMTAIDISIKKATQKIRYARSSNYPEILLSYSYIKEGDKANVDGSPYHDADRWEASVNAKWTFWEWGKTHYSVLELKSLKKELEKSRITTQERIRLEVADALLDIDTTIQNIPTTIKALDQSEMNLKVTEEQYKSKIVTISDVLDAQAQLTRAKVNYYKALYNNNLANARLLRAIGRY